MADVDEESEPRSPDRDDGLFGIDLGPARERSQTADENDTPAPPPVKRLAKTLTELLAAAAGHRHDAASTTNERRRWRK